MATSLTNKESATIQQEEWLRNIAPKYFDFDNVNNYRAGIFGYTSEVMSNITEDAYNAVTSIRREFYPNSAAYISSLYKMAAIQQIDVPMANAGTCKAALIIKEKDILPEIERPGNLNKEYRIDNNIIFMADDIPFMIDHPVIITAGLSEIKPGVQSHIPVNFPTTKTGKIYGYTTRYDLDNGINSLDTSNTVYLENKVISQYGERILLIQVTLRQVRRTTEERIIQKNGQIEIVTMDIPFDGMIAGFDVFYKKDDGSAEIPLMKQIIGAETPTTPFVQYILVDNNTLRLHFPKNIYFTPKFNSKIRVEIYTTLGEDGNFDCFNGDLVCNTESEAFPKNNSIIIAGQISGPCAGGTNISDFEDFRREICYAYTTNKTICTDHDLQAYFDKKSLSTKNKVLFFKKRDDVFQRLYGSFVLMKDNNGYVIPSNTLDMRLMRGSIDIHGNLTADSDFDAYYEQTRQLILKPGAIFRYADSNTDDAYTLRRDKSKHLLQNLTQYERQSAILRDACNHMYDGMDVPFIHKITSDHFVFRFMTNDAIYHLEDQTEQVDPQKFTSINKRLTDYLANKHIKLEGALEDYLREYSDTTEILYVPDGKKDIKKITYVEYHVVFSYFLYTNPFLISILTAPNAVSYYLTSVNDTLPCKYAAAASGAQSYIQFIMSNLHIDRNALLGENFYHLSINLMPSMDISMRDSTSNVNNLVYSILDQKEEELKETKTVVAEADGYVESIRYYTLIKDNSEDANIRDFASIAELNKYVEENHFNEDALISKIAHIVNNSEPEYMIYDPDQKKFVEIEKDCFSEFSGIYDGVYAKVKAFYPYGYGAKDATKIWTKMIRLSPVMIPLHDNAQDAKMTTGFTTLPGYTLLYDVGESFSKNNQLALINSTDTGVMKAYMTLNGPEFEEHNLFIPLIVEGYNKKNDYFTLSAYIATDDELGTNGTMHITDGVYYDDKKTNSVKEIHRKNCYISMDHTDFKVRTFIQYEDQNVPNDDHIYVNIPDSNPNNALAKWTFTNEYVLNSSDTNFALIRPIEYIRSTAIGAMPGEGYYVEDPEDNKEDPTANCKYILKSSPVIKAQWLKSPENSKYIVSVIRKNYNIMKEVYQYLEEGFGIDMKFYNTFGRSRFYRVGNKNEIYNMQSLDRVNITLNIGINLDTLAPVDIFKSRLYAFIRNYVESINEVRTQGRPIYIMNLISAIKQKFEEIGYIEYYGINDYGPEIQKIESTFNEDIQRLGYNEYVPEFINIDEVGNGAELVPSIHITLLN